MSKSYVAARAFKDAGTETAFEAGEPVTGTRAFLANYEAAGLIEPAPADETPAPETKAPTRKPRARKSA
ncbi:hypothetical protein KZ820_14385 [Sphingomonas sp. RRHST34]|uniref:Uncharacterized protein n=1 Tax=Sphingomonas citri TaxID=2862499 RepID=A0ABS7BQR4_9SPHN|nr:hypothetical protein [Sphingomonas citri]MBW6531926.1 hypothetical protein [Sphingomonas citri]